MKFQLNIPCLLILVCLSSVRCLIFTPNFYEIDLDFSKFEAQKNRIFGAQAKIYLNVTKGTYGVNEITLDAELLTIENVQILDQDNRYVQIIKSGFNGQTYSIWVNIQNDATTLVAVITYDGSVGHAGDTGVFMVDQENVIATNSYPLGARKIFPCINDPAIRTSFKINVKLVNSSWGIHHTTLGVQSPFLPAYAVGFIMTLHYRKVDGISTDKFYVWVPSYNQPMYDQVNSNNVLKDALAKGTYFYDFFSPADLDRIHIVMCPGIRTLSVVNHRLICISPDVLLSNTRRTAEMAKATAVATLNALGKHFFRCVVSPNSWEDFWLADSLALYLQYALMNDGTFKDVSFPELFTLEIQRPAMRGSPLPVVSTSLDPNILNTDETFPPAYQGAAILKMLEPLSSRSDIVKDLFGYYKNYVYQSVGTEQFLDFMSNGSMYSELNVYGKRLGPILSTWLFGVGYPYITNVTVNNNGFSLAQDRYSGSEKIHDWIIPFDYWTGDVNSQEVKTSPLWLEGNSQQFASLNINPWIEVNRLAKGMFRVNYGDKMLETVLKDDVYWALEGVERGALIDDSFVLSWTDHPKVSLGSVLSLVEKLDNETDLTSFSLAMNHVNTLRHLYSQKGLSDLYDLKIAETIHDLYSSVDWTKTKSVDAGEAMFVRSVVQTACEYGVSTCSFDAEKHANDEETVLSDLVPTINCFKVRASHQNKWMDNFNTLYSKSDIQYARADALYALACPSKQTTNGSIAIAQYLDTINSNKILLDDSQRAFSYIYSRPEHINQTINYIKDNYYSLVIRFGDNFMASLIMDLSKFLLPEYYNTILELIREGTFNTPKTSAAIVAAEADMNIRDSIVVNNLYQIENWVKTNSTTYRPLPPRNPTTVKPPPNGPSGHSKASLSFAFSLLTFIPVTYITFKNLL